MALKRGMASRKTNRPKAYQAPRTIVTPRTTKPILKRSDEVMKKKNEDLKNKREEFYEEVTKDFQDVVQSINEHGYQYKLRLWNNNSELAHRVGDNTSAFIYCIIDPGNVSVRGKFLDFADIMESHKVSKDELFQSACHMVNYGNTRQKLLGQYTIGLLRRIGHPEAVIQRYAKMLRQNVPTKGPLATKESKTAQISLQELWQEGNVRAGVLAAKFAENDDNLPLAKQLYDEAMQKIVSGEHGDLHVDMKDELSSPWLELAKLHLMDLRTFSLDDERGKLALQKAIDTYKIGIEQSDPMAHYMLALLTFGRSGGTYSQDWLINMSKAAASGHAPAAFALGVYYASVDRPPSGTATKEEQSFIARLKNFLTSGLLKPTVEVTEASGMEQYDAAVYEQPHYRFRLATEWFRSAALMTHVPSYLHLARLQLREYILPRDNLTAPYAANDDKEAKIVNKMYSKDRAELYLCTVVDAHLTIKKSKQRAVLESHYRYEGMPWTSHALLLEEYEGNLPGYAEEAVRLAMEHGIEITSEKLSRVHGLIQNEKTRRRMLEIF